MSEDVDKAMAAAEAAGIDVEALIGQAAGATVFGMVRALVDAGVSAPKALRFAAFMVVDGSAGRGATEALGLSDRQARRYRAEIRQSLQAVQLSDEVPPEYLAEWASAVEDRMLWAAKDQAE